MSLFWWALLNGLITGGVGVGIVLLGRQRRALRDQMNLLADLRRHLDDREDLEARMAELEQRLDFTERLLATARSQGRLEPPSA